MKAGVPLFWFDDLAVDHPSFGAIQLAAVRRLFPVSNADLHDSPDAPITRSEAALAIARHFGNRMRTVKPQSVRSEERLDGCRPPQLVPSGFASVARDVRLDKLPQRTSTDFYKHPPAPVRRGEFFQWLLGL